MENPTRAPSWQTFDLPESFSVSTLTVLLNLAAPATAERLGEVDFPISCSPVPQQQFNHAVATLHSFFFPET